MGVRAACLVLLLTCGISSQVLRVSAVDGLDKSWFPVIGPFFSEKVKQCQPAEFTCNDLKMCVSGSGICDGFPDCADNSDELYCPGRSQPSDPKMENDCADHNVWCAPESRCLPLEYRCDGDADCTDGSDEEGCEFKCTEYLCPNTGLCLPTSWRCDGKEDCPGGEDEQYCRRFQRANCLPGQFGCLNGSCISDREVCDGSKQCADGSDESDSCNDISLCNSHPCPAGQTCRITPDDGVTICICPPGEAPSNSTGKCERLEACGLPDWCEYRCDTTRTIPGCICPEGYRLASDNRTCGLHPDEQQPKLLFGSGSKVVLLRLETQQESTIARASSDHKMDAVAFDMATQEAYWSFASFGGAGVNRRASFRAATSRPFILSGVQIISSMAWEWVTRALYFTDTGRQHVAACNADAVCSPVVYDRNATPISLAVYPVEAALFWGEVDAESGRGAILRAGLDGTSVKELIIRDLGAPNGICVDPAGQRLYWSNPLHKTLETSRLDGSDRKKVPEILLQAPFSVAVLGNQLFWSDVRTEEIHVCNKDDGKGRKVVVKHPRSLSYHLAAVHASLQPRMRNPCINAPCSHLCLLSPPPSLGYSCFCPEDMVLDEDRSMCHESEADLILIANSKTVLKMTVGVLGKQSNQHIQSVAPKMLTALAVDYLPKTEQPNVTTDGETLELAIIYGDSRVQQIVRCRKDGTHCRVIVQDHMGLVVAIAVDPMRGNIFWADSRLGTVEVVSSDGQHRRVVAGDLRYLVHMTLSVSTGTVFVALGGLQSSIYAIAMDGSRRDAVVTEDLNAVASVWFDDVSGRLYWADLHHGVIGSTLANGTDMRYFKTNLVGPYSLTVTFNLVYWLDTYSKKLHWAHVDEPSKSYSKSLNLCNDDNRSLLLITSGGSYKRQGWRQLAALNKCQQLNCTQLCLATDGTTDICACGNGYRVSSDGRSCVRSNCNDTQFVCGDGSCIKSSWKCDGTHDCAGGEDEANCRQAQDCAGKFHCASGRQCVQPSVVCNSVPDCPDASDERNCTARACDKTGFRCSTGACVPLTSKCDNYIDCSDASDEAHCGHGACNAKDMFQCRSGLCLKSEWFCDGHPDCPDASDEPADCRQYNQTCLSGSRICSDGVTCMQDSLWCDCTDDCPDAGDETAAECGLQHVQQCKVIVTAVQEQCDLGLWRCVDSQCIDETSRCNGRNDCSGGEDEIGCDFVNCPGSTQKVHVTWLCDGAIDCEDGSDETDVRCERNATAAAPTERPQLECGESQHLCADGWQCVQQDRICNGMFDCDDRSDEGGLCDSACERGICAHSCRSAPWGAICSCRDGYRLNSDGKTCDDVDECRAEASPCWQVCNNSVGSFKCSCYPGYWPEGDGRACRALVAPTLLISSGKRIVSEVLGSHQVSLVLRQKSLMPGRTAMDAWTGRIVFQDVNSAAVYELPGGSNGTVFPGLLVDNVTSLTALALDWTTKNVYMAERQGNDGIIRVCSPRGDCRTIYRRANETLNAMVLMPEVGILYACGRSAVIQPAQGLVIRLLADGTQRQVMIQRKTGPCGGMDLDRVSGRLWWSDHYFDRLISMRLDGSHIQVLRDTGLYRPTDVAVFDHWVYTVNQNSSVRSCHTHLGLNATGEHELLTVAERPFCNTIYNKSMPLLAMTLDHRLRQPSRPDTNDSNVGVCDRKARCAYLCLTDDDLRLKCYCPDRLPQCVAERGLEDKSAASMAVAASGSSSPRGLAVTLVVCLAVGVLAGAVVWYLRKKRHAATGAGGSGAVSCRHQFQNPAYGVTPSPSSAPKDNWQIHFPTEGTTSAGASSSTQAMYHANDVPDTSFSESGTVDVSLTDKLVK